MEYLILAVWAIWAILEERFISGTIGLLIIASFIGFVWNWFIPNVFLINVVHLSFFTLVWLTSFIGVVISFLAYFIKR